MIISIQYFLFCYINGYTLQGDVPMDLWSHTWNHFLTDSFSFLHNFILISDLHKNKSKHYKLLLESSMTSGFRLRGLVILSPWRRSDCGSKAFKRVPLQQRPFFVDDICYLTRALFPLRCSSLLYSLRTEPPHLVFTAPEGKILHRSHLLWTLFKAKIHQSVHSNNYRIVLYS